MFVKTRSLSLKLTANQMGANDRDFLRGATPWDLGDNTPLSEAVSNAGDRCIGGRVCGRNLRARRQFRKDGCGRETYISQSLDNPLGGILTSRDTVVSVVEGSEIGEIGL